MSQFHKRLGYSCQRSNLRILNLFLRQFLLQGGLLHRQFLPVEILQCLVFSFILFPDQKRLLPDQIIFGKIHGLFSFRRRIDRGNGNINLVGCHGGQQGLEIHILHFQLDSQFICYGLRQADINAVHAFSAFHGCIQEFIRRESGRSSYNQFSFLFHFLHEGAFCLSCRGTALCRVISAACQSHHSGQRQSAGQYFPSFFHSDFLPVFSYVRPKEDRFTFL